MAEWNESDGLDRAALRRRLAARLARWKVDGRWLREVFVTPDPGPEVMLVRDRLLDEGCKEFSRRLERSVRDGETANGQPEMVVKMAVRLLNMTFADIYASPDDSHDDEELLDTLTDAILRLLYGVTPSSAPGTRR
jgi:hypothetical protein